MLDLNLKARGKKKNQATCKLYLCYSTSWCNAVQAVHMGWGLLEGKKSLRFFIGNRVKFKMQCHHNRGRMQSPALKTTVQSP